MSNKITKWDPFAELNALQKQFFGDDWASSAKGISIPTTDVYMKDHNLVIEAHLPNFDKKDIHVECENGCLVISASRHETDEDKNKKYVVRESSGNFYRRIALPEGADVDGIEANLEDGVLKVLVPITPLPEPKKISISATKKSE